jgi:molybdate transport system ATP-binding protein
VSLELRVHVDDRDVEVDLDVGDGQTVAILGPNGAGKSSVLATIAGTLQPDRGHARLGDTTLFDLTEGRTWMRSHQRDVALLAQDPLLFPHLSVLDNVAFGPRAHGIDRETSRATARHWLDEVNAEALADRRPAELSGGQAQRVAVARALATDPALLLLDEPMAALDVTVVPAMRQLLRRVLTDRSAIVVTHEVLDALLLADRVVVMDEGRIVEQGPTKEVLARPRSAFGASLAGLNLISGSAVDGGIVTLDGRRIEGMATPAIANGTATVAVFDPAAVAVHLERPGGSPRNVFAAVVQELEPRGSQVRVRTADASADITMPAVAELDLFPGTEVFLAVKASEVSLYPA